MNSNITKKTISQLQKLIEEFDLEKKKKLCDNEAQTRKFLIEPFFQILNYGLTDLIPEYTTDFGDSTGKKVDYAILLNKKNTLLIEAKKSNSKLTDKEAGQLNNYFSNIRNSKIAILTNGVEYRFYSDILEKNIIDINPFFIFNLENYSDDDIKKLIYIDKRFIDINEIVEEAKGYVFNEDFEKALFNEIELPSEKFLKIVHGNMSFKTRFNDDTKKRMISLLNSSLLKSLYDRKILSEAKSNSAGIVTTEQEIKAYHTIRTILIRNKKIPNERIGYEDKKTFFSINIDNMSRKIICKLIINDKKMTMTIGDTEYTLDSLDCIVKYEKELISRTIELVD